MSVARWVADCPQAPPPPSGDAEPKVCPVPGRIVTESASEGMGGFAPGCVPPSPPTTNRKVALGHWTMGQTRKLRWSLGANPGETRGRGRPHGTAGKTLHRPPSKSVAIYPPSVSFRIRVIENRCCDRRGPTPITTTTTTPLEPPGKSTPTGFEPNKHA